MDKKLPDFPPAFQLTINLNGNAHFATTFGSLEDLANPVVWNQGCTMLHEHLLRWLDEYEEKEITGKETSSRVSTAASQIMRMTEAEPGEHVSGPDYNRFLRLAKRVAGSALSQDQTPGQNEDVASTMVEGEPQEIGGHDIDRDGPIPFSS